MFIMIGQLTGLNSIVFILVTIIINKLLNRNELSIGNMILILTILSQTGFARLIYIKNKNIDIKQS